MNRTTLARLTLSLVVFVSLALGQEENVLQEYLDATHTENSNAGLSRDWSRGRRCDGKSAERRSRAHADCVSACELQKLQSAAASAAGAATGARDGDRKRRALCLRRRAGEGNFDHGEEGQIHGCVADWSSCK